MIGVDIACGTGLPLALGQSGGISSCALGYMSLQLWGSLVMNFKWSGYKGSHINLPWGRVFKYKNSFFIRLRCPSLGAIPKRANDCKAKAMSSLPRVTTQLALPTMERYSVASFSEHNGESLSLGWSASAMGVLLVPSWLPSCRSSFLRDQ